MARRPKQGDPEKLRAQLVELLENYEAHLLKGDLRTKVRELVPANHLLCDLGSSLVDNKFPAARDRILFYLKECVCEVVHGDELMVVAGISEYARRIRELRVEHGWQILSGVTAADMLKNATDDDAEAVSELPVMKPDEYLLISTDQDRDAAHRWNLANDIRKDKDMSVRDKILLYLRKNSGHAVTGEELRYVANNKSEWARRTRELRTEYGWPVVTQSNGRPDLPVGVYVLEEDKQSPPHDRKIKDAVRRSVLMRDKYTCQECGWNQDLWNPSDARHLEAHHQTHHAKGGSNEEDNLITYCNICHDEVHRREDSEKK
ncbi:MAG: HNH endonuclease [Hyphomicrobiaceae bacterium]|nr:HNH endonuclease [Hyphomicrobiaceae bacterium]